MKIIKTSSTQITPEVGQICNEYQESNENTYSCNYINNAIEKKQDKLELLYSGVLKGGQSTTLDTSKVKDFLRIVAIGYQRETIVYDMCLISGILSSGNVYHASGVAHAWDDQSSIYESYSTYTPSNGSFSHVRIGYHKGSTSWTARNNNADYYIARIYTY